MKRRAMYRAGFRSTPSFLDASKPKRTATHVLKVCFDGGCAGAAHHGYGSYALWLDDVKIHHGRQEYGDGCTNNIAEWLTLQRALEYAITACNPENTALRVRGDSQLVVYRMSGKWRPTPKAVHLREYATEVQRLAGMFASAEFDWWPRENSVRVLGH